MLSIPEFGKTIFKLGQREYKISCLTDITDNWLEKSINALKTKQSFSVQTPVESFTLKCTIGYFITHIFLEDNNKGIDNFNYEVAHINMLEFCTNLYEDINNNMTAWIENQSSNLNTLEEKKHILEEKLFKLKEMIDEFHGDFETFFLSCGCI